MKEPSQFKNWTLPAPVLDFLWTQIYPRIVALKWKDAEYAGNFESDYAFSVREFNRVGQLINEQFKLPEGIGIWVQSDNQRRTDIMLVPEGIILPWPETPDASKFYQAYSLLGGALPKRQASLAADDTISNWKISTGDILTTEPVSEIIARAFKNDDYIFGKDLSMILGQSARLTARSWDDKTFKAEYIASPLSKLSDISLPGSMNVKVIDGHKYDCISNWTLQLALPDAPNLDEILDELIVGAAENPLYTRTGSSSISFCFGEPEL